MTYKPFLHPTTLKTLKILQDNGVQPYLYGSQGVSLYLGKFRTFGDIDVLLPSNWLQDDWQDLCKILQSIGFTLTDEHEHEFTDAKGLKIAFADIQILVRDKIVTALDEAIVYIKVNNQLVHTFTPQVFLRAYRFSLNDGYRQQKRGKNDAEIISMLESYLCQK